VSIRSMNVKSGILASASLCLAWMSSAPRHEQVPVFKADVRLVEVYATIVDHSGKYVTGLSQDQFEVRDNGVVQQISAFEAVSSDLSCAILLDATGSMAASLPAVKNAILRLIDDLRPDDSFAVYTFNTSLSLVQDFTRDKPAAKKAVLSIRAGGATAWFDAVAQMAIDLAKLKGKKGVIAFTDGGENASFLNAQAGITRARVAGIPIYTIAQGDALKDPALLAQIRQISLGTDGWTYAVRNSREIDEVFTKIAQDLKHTYMLAYPAPPSADAKWRTIQLMVKNVKNLRIRAKEGYFPN
jgi:Ca-activated chloride channel homolog